MTLTCLPCVIDATRTIEAVGIIHRDGGDGGKSEDSSDDSQASTELFWDTSTPSCRVTVMMEPWCCNAYKKRKENTNVLY